MKTPQGQQQLLCGVSVYPGIQCPGAEFLQVTHQTLDHQSLQWQHCEYIEPNPNWLWRLGGTIGVIIPVSDFQEEVADKDNR